MNKATLEWEWESVNSAPTDSPAIVLVVLRSGSVSFGRCVGFDWTQEDSPSDIVGWKYAHVLARQIQTKLKGTGK